MEPKGRLYPCCNLVCLAISIYGVAIVAYTHTNHGQLTCNCILCLNFLVARAFVFFDFFLDLTLSCAISASHKIATLHAAGYV